MRRSGPTPEFYAPFDIFCQGLWVGFQPPPPPSLVLRLSESESRVRQKPLSSRHTLSLLGTSVLGKVLGSKIITRSITEIGEINNNIFRTTKNECGS